VSIPSDHRRQADISVYVHLPWCVRKCPYCDFNSHVVPASLPQQQYVDALRRDLDASAEELADRAVSSVFFGGGTPSLFNAAAIAEILSALTDRLTLRADAEITLEANPGTAEAGRFAGFRSAGVNRLSLGAQSFSDPALRALGRIHTSAENYQAWESALKAGFENINLDLMYGLPGQSLAGACADVATALSLGAPHISHYQLTLEPGTQFQRHPPALPDEDALAAMESRCEAALTEAGLQRYEVSAYAQPGFTARHNLNYWRFGDYLGLGAGAHSKLTQTGIQRRSMRRRNPLSYIRHAGTTEATVDARALQADDLAFEFMLNRLRLTAPLPPAEFEQATGLSFALVAPTFNTLAAQGLMGATPRGWAATVRGRELLNEVIGRFLPAGSDLCTSAAGAREK
jgi:putative oxygen-independent coproporphyrinogen III oxidase